LYRVLTSRPNIVIIGQLYHDIPISIPGQLVDNLRYINTSQQAGEDSTGTGRNGESWQVVLSDRPWRIVGENAVHADVISLPAPEWRPDTGQWKKPICPTPMHKPTLTLLLPRVFARSRIGLAFGSLSRSHRRACPHPVVGACASCFCVVIPAPPSSRAPLLAVPIAQGTR
jgi:hypothetical protein